ncbi:MAG: hypothetical protein IPL55_06460 [Saprospiraceae bacterium]|nr:hypothetical protein [Saprospiraceae bacterium]
MRAFSNFPYSPIRDIVLSNLKNDNLHIAATAANVILTNGIIDDVPLYAEYDTLTIPWQVRSKMNAAVLAYTALYYTKSKSAFSERIQQNINSSSNIYEKAAYVDTLSKDPFNYNILIQLYKQEKDNQIKMAALSGLGMCSRSHCSSRLSAMDMENKRGNTQLAYLRHIQCDISQIAIACGILNDPACNGRNGSRIQGF